MGNSTFRFAVTMGCALAVTNCASVAVPDFPDAATTTTDAGSGSSGDGGTVNGGEGGCVYTVCHVDPSAQNNELNVGGYCEKGKSMCPPPSFCTADNVPAEWNPSATGVCSTGCTMGGNCGTGASCFVHMKTPCEPAFTVCLPNSCPDFTAGVDGPVGDAGH
jgi:hypothetical protein